MNFDYEIVEPKNGTFGRKNEDGYWDGVVGDLSRGVSYKQTITIKSTKQFITSICLGN